LPKDIRDNCTVLLLFRTKNMQVIDGIAEEIADDVPYEDFLNVYHQAIDGQDHGFLTIDFNPKKHRFRRCFDTYIPDASDPGQPGHLRVQLQPKGAKSSSQQPAPAVNTKSAAGSKPDSAKRRKH
jgi:hypothetical protein